MIMITFYDAFAGIGGFRLGLERAGFKCVGSCEIDDYARKVYYKNFGEWPDRDIREVTDIKGADMLCGGFPCQDISVAGKGAGFSGERSGLWWELARLIENCVPRWVFLENVPMLVHRGLGAVLGFLAESGYDAEWDCLPAAAFGAPHRRDRIWVVAYPKSTRQPACPMGQGEMQSRGSSSWPEQRWKVEPDVGRVADGIPKGVDRLRCLGNAVVPQVVEWIGKRIGEIDGRSKGS